jgi:hypothetical protein
MFHRRGEEVAEKQGGKVHGIASAHGPVAYATAIV